MTWLFTRVARLIVGAIVLVYFAGGLALPVLATDKPKPDQPKAEKSKEGREKDDDDDDREKREKEKKAERDHPKGEKNEKQPADPPKEKKPVELKPVVPDPIPEKKPPEKTPVAKPLVAEMLAEVDEDFQFQGEYLSSGRERWGLQVIAEGNGKFRALALPGGLPGAGWTRSSQIELQGERKGSTLLLESNVAAVEIYGDRAELVGIDRVPIASLMKIHRISCTQDARPPAGATVLFDGSSTDNWNNAKISAEGLLQVGQITKKAYGDFRLHLEFRTPYMPAARGQGRGNSGVYIQQRYEVQILDSFGLEGKNNECGGLYTARQPDVNMCLPPLSWQTYDIYFTAARFDADGKKTADARLTVYHNGEAIHDNIAIPRKTGAGQAENAEPRPILLQDHGNPVRFRNIWIVEGAFPPGLPAPCVCQTNTAAKTPYAPTSNRRRRR